MIKLRGHHLLCILNFEGKGYSEEFIKNMYEVKKALEEKEFILTEDADNICDKCPYLEKNICKNEKREGEIKERDRKVIEYLGLKLGERYFYPLLVKEILEKINMAIFESFCSDCSWFELCKGNWGGGEDEKSFFSPSNFTFR